MNDDQIDNESEAVDLFESDNWEWIDDLLVLTGYHDRELYDNNSDDESLDDIDPLSLAAMLYDQHLAELLASDNDS